MSFTIQIDSDVIWRTLFCRVHFETYCKMLHDL